MADVPLALDELSVGLEAVDSGVAAAVNDVIDVVDGGLFLSNGFVRSDGFNVLDWNLL